MEIKLDIVRSETKKKSKYRKLVLVHSPLDLSAASTPEVASLAPLGLLSLATYIKSRHDEIEMEVIDGDLLGLEKAKELLKISRADIIGIGVQACESYNSALELARTAKENGAKVVFGGEQSTIRARQILSNRDFIDFVIKGQGELGLEKLISEPDETKIPALIYRKEGQLVENSPHRLSIRDIPIPRREWTDQNIYAKKFRNTLESQITGFKSFATVRTQDGCMKAIKGGVCTFCVRDDLLSASLRSPEQFWEEAFYFESLGIDYAWDISPSFSSVGKGYLKALAKARPDLSKIRFRIYARADDLADEEKTEAIADIGIENVLVGFDSGNQRCLDSSNKGTTLDQHRKAAENLRNYGISTYAAFVLGHLAENYGSMKDTLNHAVELKSIIGERLFRIATCSKMQLYPSSGEWNAYLTANPELKKFYDEADVIDIQKLSKDYFIDFLHLDPDKADEIAEQIRSLSPIRSGKDLRKNLVH